MLQAIELEDLLERTHRQGFFDNTETVYAGDLPPELLADLNARVARYSDGEAAAQCLDKYYNPTGDLRVPLVSLHTSLDPVVPWLHENSYRSLVEAEGRGEFLHQVRIDRYGHLAFTSACGGCEGRECCPGTWRRSVGVRKNGETGRARDCVSIAPKRRAPKVSRGGER